MFIFASGQPLTLVSHTLKVASSMVGCFDSCRGNIFSYLRTAMHFSPDLTEGGDKTLDKRGAYSNTISRAATFPD